MLNLVFALCINLSAQFFLGAERQRWISACEPIKMLADEKRLWAQRGEKG